MLRLITSSALLACASADKWDSLREGIEAWAAISFDAKFAVNVGDETGTLFTWSSPDFSMSNTRMAGASLSKWPAAVMVSGLVADGTMSYDDKANKYIKWWTKDPSDKRSEVTLRSLLSFTSGFYDDGGGLCLETYDKCAEKLYNDLAKSFDYKGGPGTSFQYLSCHLQFAGAMAVAASGKNIQTLFSEYLYKPFNMTKTSWEPPRNPSMAAGITTTGDDFENLMQRLLTYKVLPKEVLDQMETDWTSPAKGVSPSGDGWFGHYAMGHWWECLGYGTPSERVSPLYSDCVESKIQAGPGEFGFYPSIDRSGGGGAAGPKRQPYYFQVILQEPDALSGIPEYLRIIAKPVVDIILAGEDPDTYPREKLLAAAAGLVYEDVDYIKQSLGECHCLNNKFKRDEPYSSLEKGTGPPQPAPSGHHHHGGANRRDIERNGTGLLLREIVPIVKELGNCTCANRK